MTRQEQGRAGAAAYYRMSEFDKAQMRLRQQRRRAENEKKKKENASYGKTKK